MGWGGVGRDNNTGKTMLSRSGRGGERTQRLNSKRDDVDIGPGP